MDKNEQNEIAKEFPENEPIVKVVFPFEFSLYDVSAWLQIREIFGLTTQAGDSLNTFTIKKSDWPKLGKGL